jgi:dipeptidyl aminopeptidase/acylaminoacyl peptidase
MDKINMAFTFGKRKKIILFFFAILTLIFSVGVMLILELTSAFVLSRLYGETLAFSPDGNQIVFSVIPTHNKKCKGIYVFQVENKELTRLTHPDYYDNYPTVSPNGQRVIFSRGTKFGAGLWVMDTDGSNARRLTSPFIFYVDYEASFSPSGKNIAFFRGTYLGIQKLMLLDMESGNVTCLQKEVDYGSRNIIWKNENEIYFFAHASSSLDCVNIVDIQTGILTKRIPLDSTEDNVSYYRDISFDTHQELVVQCPQKKYLYQFCIRGLFSEDKPQFVIGEQFNATSARFTSQGKSVLLSTGIRYKNGIIHPPTVYLLDIETKHIEAL